MKKCYECEDYSHCYTSAGELRGDGICNILRDGQTCCQVLGDIYCIWNNSSERKLSDTEIQKRDKESSEDFLNFRAHLKRASEIVAGWPKMEARYSWTIAQKRRLVCRITIIKNPVSSLI